MLWHNGSPLCFLLGYSGFSIEAYKPLPFSFCICEREGSHFLLHVRMQFSKGADTCKLHVREGLISQVYMEFHSLSRKWTKKTSIDISQNKAGKCQKISKKKKPYETMNTIIKHHENANQIDNKNLFCHRYNFYCKNSKR